MIRFETNLGRVEISQEYFANLIGEFGPQLLEERKVVPVIKVKSLVPRHRHLHRPFPEER